MLRLRQAIFEGYVAAGATTWHYLDSEDELTAGFQLLRNYRIYTRFVLNLATRIWPEIDLKWLAARS